jgi:succinate-semialdehyde dehydrogenase/glutarate-semialdehyde dehydrogenase
MATTCVTSRLLNAGQSCIAAKRFVVAESIRPRFEDAARRCAWQVGDPPDERTQVGLLERHDLRHDLH